MDLRAARRCGAPDGGEACTLGLHVQSLHDVIIYHFGEPLKAFVSKEWQKGII